MRGFVRFFRPLWLTSYGQQTWFEIIDHRWQPGLLMAYHYSDVIMSMTASQITSLTIVYSTFQSGADQRKTSKPRVTGLYAGNSPVTGEFPAQSSSNAEMFQFDDVIMTTIRWHSISQHHKVLINSYLHNQDETEKISWSAFVHYKYDTFAINRKPYLA